MMDYESMQKALLERAQKYGWGTLKFAPFRPIQNARGRLVLVPCLGTVNQTLFKLGMALFTEGVVCIKKDTPSPIVDAYTSGGVSLSGKAEKNYPAEIGMVIPSYVSFSAFQGVPPGKPDPYGEPLLEVLAALLIDDEWKSDLRSSKCPMPYIPGVFIRIDGIWGFPYVHVHTDGRFFIGVEQDQRHADRDRAIPAFSEFFSRYRRRR
jgi:hypothetical protein